MTEINPVTVELAIRTCSERIAKGVGVCDERYRAFLTAERAYDVAVAQAYLDSAGSPVHERKHITELATQAEREIRDTADAAYRYADRQARALGDELRAWQSVNKSVMSMYSAVGVTER